MCGVKNGKRGAAVVPAGPLSPLPNQCRMPLQSVDEIVEELGVVQAVAQQRVAGLILTYRCTIACAHCLFNCSPRQPRRVMTVEQGVR